MKTFIAIALLSGIAMHAQAPTTLDSLRDRKRVLLVFAGSNNPGVEHQWATLVDQRDEAAERDLVTVLLTRSLIKKHDGNSPPSATLSHADEQAARVRFHITANQFTAILLGKDGGEKLRSNQPIPWQTLQSTIDAMPMRQSEASRSR